MNPTPAKRPRRSSSPHSPAESSASQAQQRARPPTASPSHTILPAPIPSGPPFPPYAPGPSGWQSAWRSGSSRRSFDAGSPVTSVSPKMEGGDEVNASGMILTRDVSSRAPRSMMACTRCRRQKMKCDGPSQVPCRGCRQSGQPCIFEPRSRPKSISVIPSRPPFYPARPGSPAGFYPAGPQPAPPVTSRGPTMQQESYMFRQAREPMPPPPATSLTALASPYPPPGRHTPPPPPTAASASSGQGGPSFYAPPPNVIHPPPFVAPSVLAQPPPVESQETRLRNVESALRSFSAIPSSILNLQSSLNAIQRTLSPRRKIEVHESVWESYRTRAWPLTPWLVGLRDPNGLPGIVVNLLGKRTVADRDEPKRREADDLLADAVKEVGRLVSSRADWAREEMRSLGVLATWTNDHLFAGIAISQARSLGLDKIHLPRRSHDDWREWIYLVIMDHLCHLPDYIVPVARQNLASLWRERLSSGPPGDPAIRDRDLKLLAWLEYAETLADVHHLQQATRLAPAPAEASPEETIAEDRRSKAMDSWRKYGPRWETWAGTWAARSDPILALHYNYAVLFTTSPAFFGDDKIWEDLAAAKEGYTQLERARDAAMGVIQAICSVEIGRTIPYSFALYRPLLGLAILHLVSLCIVLPTSAIISTPHVLGVLRQAYEIIMSHQPLDRIPSSDPSTGQTHAQGQCLLGEIVDSWRVELGNSLIGTELGRETWKKIVG
ncbi:hypothetical protein CI109_104298 [Kwoniella shandongensis]|uniref:Uncharacterized protein n=1 Tax=Kwoniella shandongensis TaxID=1734106 RepID=A0A5M6C0W3_9TREE|nr:uncharacterized protein CI109_002797 [Kwoniella shandongensis]KAA5528643.1 hypothetical protein CI109_002797 [Kwoniella shandongensis]